MDTKNTFRRFPSIKIDGYDNAVVTDCNSICSQISMLCTKNIKTVIVVECYPGIDQNKLRMLFSELKINTFIYSDDLALPPAEIDAQVKRELTNDPVFGIMTTYRLEEFYPIENLEKARCKIDNTASGIVLVYGVGASLVCEGDILILADITRWEIQLRYRRGLSNWRTTHTDLPRNEKYKRGFFAEWRWADRIKDRILPKIDFYLDMTIQNTPAMVSGKAYRDALMQVASQPFRMVPYFDPGVWGGNWMKTHFELPENGKNYAWSFDGVPEENSLLLDFCGKIIQTPALNLVYSHPQKLLGDRVHARFGKEFPIRFDMLDTINGQNLSLQVHPLTEYIQQNFHMHYTQDESYYLLDTQGNDACVYLGTKTGTNPDEMIYALKEAQTENKPFPVEKYINRIPVQKHDHLLIPAGTVHCSGANTMVLEISATPYIFTFKLWDWGRLDLDGRPRPIHIDHGAANIQWQRDTEWVQENLINSITLIHQSEQGIVERTGLHEREFLDTYRISTSTELPIHRNGSVHMLNLVEGELATLISEDGRFAPMELHYAETCIVPEAAGTYLIHSIDGTCVRIVIACVRS